MKKITCSLLALLMAISPLSAFALTDAPIVPPGNTPVTLNTTPLTFNATVPTGLPLNLAANGVVTPATEASIINGAIGPIKVVSITTEAVDGWVLTSYTDDFSTKKVNSKDIALQFNKDNVTAAGSIVLTPQNWPTIEGNGSLRLDYQGKLAPQSEGFTEATAAHVSFVLDWDDTPISETDIEDTSNPEYSFTAGDSKTINFSFKNSKSDKVVFTSSNPEVATVELVDNSQLRLVSGIKMAKITAISNGTTTITGTLEDGTSSSIEVVVTDKAVKGLVLKSPANKTSYIEGENFDAIGLVIEAINNNGSSDIVTNYTLSNNTNLAANQTEVILSYSGHEISLPITVVAKTLSNITIATQPSKISYIEGNNFDAAGMIVKANYNNGTSETITNYTLSNNTNLVKGQPNVVVSYANKTVNVPITVVAKSVSSLTIVTQPTKTVYKQQSAFDATGLKLRVNYNNNTSVDIDNGWIISSNGDSLVAGQKSVTVNYGGKSVDVPITVDKHVMATDADFSGTTNGDFKYIGTDKYVEIPHVIKGVPVTSYRGMFERTSVEGVESTNTNVTNMSNMFDTSKATTLDLSNLDTSNVTNMYNMFYNCKATTLDVSNFDTSNVTNMGGMFYMSYATTLDLSSFDTSKVTNMSGMFWSSNVTILDLSSFDTSNVTSMYSMFQSSNVAWTLDLSNFDTSKVTTMGSMFSESYVRYLDVSNFDTSKVTDMGSMFQFSKAWTLNLSSFDTSNVTNMSYMFQYSEATTGYAKTQADANKFNATEGKPSDLTFRVE